MKSFLFRHRFYVLGGLLGAVAGYLYWQEIGCLSGSCAITSTWERMTPYGALMGGLLGGMVQDWWDDRHREETPSERPE
ncbi:MAG: hypothetical protein D6722_07145 [Bacteroidetes bacterium]|nr:MAG: hypothetical protein D6722_07145 [Bacteroidota bacterium]